MPNIPIVTGQKLIKILLKKGFKLNRVSGSHHILVNQAEHLTVSVPVHKGKTLGKGITLAIIKDSGMSIEEFLKLI